MLRIHEAVHASYRVYTEYEMLPCFLILSVIKLINLIKWTTRSSFYICNTWFLRRFSQVQQQFVLAQLQTSNRANVESSDLLSPNYFLFSKIVIEIFNLYFRNCYHQSTVCNAIGIKNSTEYQLQYAYCREK